MRKENTVTINSQRFLWIAVVMLAITAASSAQIRVTVSFGPPALPIYEQPLCPGEGYIWTRDFGPGTMTSKTITGCLEPGSWLRRPAFSGLPAGGVGEARGLSSMKAIGDRWSVSMEESTTASVTTAAVTRAGVGKTTISTT